MDVAGQKKTRGNYDDPPDVHEQCRKLFHTVYPLVVLGICFYGSAQSMAILMGST